MRKEFMRVLLLLVLISCSHRTMVDQPVRGYIIYCMHAPEQVTPLRTGSRIKLDEAKEHLDWEEDVVWGKGNCWIEKGNI